MRNKPRHTPTSLLVLSSTKHTLSKQERQREKRVHDKQIKKGECVRACVSSLFARVCVGCGSACVRIC